MGTNYFWRDQPCGTCGRYDEVHVGKSSAGWSFMFRAHPHALMRDQQGDEQPEWGYDRESPFGFPVMSRADWRTVFAGRRGELWDEYGRRVDEDPTAWLDRLEPPLGEQIAWEEGNSHWPSYMEKTGWRDAEGFRFDDREFS